MCVYVCVCIYDPISSLNPHFWSLIFKMKKSLIILTISKSRGKKLKYPGICVEEEKVFANFLALLSINVMELNAWQNFN